MCIQLCIEQLQHILNLFVLVVHCFIKSPVTLPWLLVHSTQQPLVHVNTITVLGLPLDHNWRVVTWPYPWCKLLLAPKHIIICPGECIASEVRQEIVTGCCAVVSCLTAVANCLPEVFWDSPSFCWGCQPLASVLKCLKQLPMVINGCKGFISGTSIVQLTELSIQGCHILPWCWIAITWYIASYCYMVARISSINWDTTSVQPWGKFGATGGKLLYWDQVVGKLHVVAMSCLIVSNTCPGVAADLLWKLSILVQVLY